MNNYFIVVLSLSGKIGLENKEFDEILMANIYFDRI